LEFTSCVVAGVGFAVLTRPGPSGHKRSGGPLVVRGQAVPWHPKAKPRNRKYLVETWNLLFGAWNLLRV
jgi:hypothetical protein